MSPPTVTPSALVPARMAKGPPHARQHHPQPCGLRESDSHRINRRCRGHDHSGRTRSARHQLPRNWRQRCALCLHECGYAYRFHTYWRCHPQRYYRKLQLQRRRSPGRQFYRSSTTVSSATMPHAAAAGHTKARSTVRASSVTSLPKMVPVYANRTCTTVC